MQGTGTDVRQIGRELLQANFQKEVLYSSLYKEKHLGGRSGILPVTYCDKPGLMVKLMGQPGTIREDRAAARMDRVKQNRQASAMMRREKNAKTTSLLTKHKPEVTSYSEWKLQQLAPPAQEPTQKGKKIVKRPQTAVMRAKRPYEMSAPKIAVPPDETYIANYIQEKHGNIISAATVYPNYKQIDAKEHQNLMSNQAQE